MRLTHALLSVVLSAAVAAAQDTTQERLNPDIDPLALQVLQATTDTLKNATLFTFRATMQRETLGSNNEIVTFFRQNDVAVSRPDRARLHITGEQQTADVFFNRGELFIYSPEKNVYTGLGTITPNLDLMVGRLEEQQIQLPMSPFFRSDPYKTLTDSVRRAAVIGRVEFGGKTYHHLVFVEDGAEWQLWVEGGQRPLPRRAQVIYTSMERQPRITYDFTDWNLSPNLPADYFVFNRPKDAVAVSVLSPEQQ